MATLPSTQICHPFPTLSPKRNAPTLCPRAMEPEKDQSGGDPAEPEGFEDRLNQVRLKYRSGKGKKAEQRKAKKTGSTSSRKKGGGVFLPPVPLKEPISGGLKVEFGFTPYTERLNGRLACLGLAALLLVELGSGKSLINYHTPAVLLIQVYFAAAVAALFVKYEKEKASVWPEPSKK
ncbi:hypothetical protein H6P81_006635 [Aristolochia fimbriata]|uniref:Uncharacterized protein n=1 Tax=Aristolochia fimbriata TaxID=158543 RepID=A0AAV7F0L5_ARIFI|nr:hypothetical protein H6P81_006635 [Aristolochia fimbriata]